MHGRRNTRSVLAQSIPSGFILSIVSLKCYRCSRFMFQSSQEMLAKYNKSQKELDDLVSSMEGL